MPFDQNNFNYGEDGVPILSAREIEQIAKEVLEKHCPGVLQRPIMTPVIEILKALENTTHLKSVITDLGYKKNAKILGRINFSRKLLSLDTLLTTEREIQMRFTAAHEIGHWILHRWNYENWNFESFQPTQDNFEDDENSLHRLDRRSPKEWLEWQANVFAAALIMPQDTFRRALAETQYSLGIRRNIGIVWVSDAKYSRRDYMLCVERLGEIYGVSLASVRVRLETQNLIYNEPAQSLHSTDDVIKSESSPL
jgi:Zn-dependent peptidase ImmA (M78 family)